MGEGEARISLPIDVERDGRLRFQLGRDVECILMLPDGSRRRGWVSAGEVYQDGSGEASVTTTFPYRAPAAEAVRLPLGDEAPTTGASAIELAKAAFRTEGKVAAVKVYRSCTGSSLPVACDAVRRAVGEDAWAGTEAPQGGSDASYEEQVRAIAMDWKRPVEPDTQAQNWSLAVAMAGIQTAERQKCADAILAVTPPAAQASSMETTPHLSTYGDIVRRIVADPQTVVGYEVGVDQDGTPVYLRPDGRMLQVFWRHDDGSCVTGVVGKAYDIGNPALREDLTFSREKVERVLPLLPEEVRATVEAALLGSLA